jgi:ankyrin repeat protein
VSEPTITARPARMLLQRTAINKLAPFRGRTALPLACLEGHDMVVQHVNEAGASVTAVDELEAPLHLALKRVILQDPTNT